MALRSDWSQRPCPIARSADVLADPWVLVILRELTYGVRRFDELRAQTEATDRTLVDRLNQMIDQGLVRREQYSGNARPRYEYFLTASGQAARPILDALAAWGQEQTAEPELASPFQLICSACGTPGLAAARCAHCESALIGSDSRWIRPEMNENNGSPTKS